MMKKLLLCCAALSVLVAGITWILFDQPSARPVLSSPVAYTIVIDAGHGGEDGGAVSVTGAAESQINLAISCKLEDILAFYGTVPIMLRREDISLHDQSANTLREKKVSDLHNRVSRIEDTPSALLASIHQNSYPDTRYHGAQVFYAPTAGSDKLADHIRRSLLVLDQENTREIKQIPSSVYLMNHISCPAVLVECGFLSNTQEESLLRQSSYQKKIAGCLAGSLLTAPTLTNIETELT
jgi:N-acetylmuramoyl-L-alanine amidase